MGKEKNEDIEHTTGFASMIIQVPQENWIALLSNSGKDEANTKSKQGADADGIRRSWSWRKIRDLDASGAHEGGCAASMC